MEPECARFQSVPTKLVAAGKDICAKDAVLSSEGMLYNLLVDTKSDAEVRRQKIEKEFKQLDTYSQYFQRDVKQEV